MIKDQRFSSSKIRVYAADWMHSVQETWHRGDSLRRLKANQNAEHSVRKKKKNKNKCMQHCIKNNLWNSEAVKYTVFQSWNILSSLCWQIQVKSYVYGQRSQPRSRFWSKFKLSLWSNIHAKFKFQSPIFVATNVTQNSSLSGKSNLESLVINPGQVLSPWLQG